MRGWSGRERLALSLCVLSLACCAGGLWIELAAHADGRTLQRSALSDVVVAVLFPLTGLVVLRRDPRNRTAWVLLSCALVGVSVLAHQWAYDAGISRPGALPAGGLFVWLAAWTYWPYWLQPTLLPVLFPHGRPPAPRWAVFVRVVLAVTAVAALGTMLKDDDDVEGMGLHNPLGIPGFDVPAIVLQAGGTAVLALLATPVAIVGLARRQRRASGAERDQLAWLLLGFATCFVLGVASALAPAGEELLFSAGFAAIPLSIGVAVVRHGLFDVEVVVNRTIVYALLTGASLLLYVGLVALAGRYVSGDGAGPLFAAVVVAAAAAGRSRLQRLVDRRLFGTRRDPMALMGRLGETTAAAPEPLQALVETVREELRLPFVQVLDDSGQPLASSGEPVVGTYVLPVVDRGRRLGVLVVGRRSRRERVHPEEQAALAEVARRAGSVLTTTALGQDLQRSYERTVLAREEERKRLRRDLHDGLGPELAGMALQLDSLAGRLGQDPALAARAQSLRDRLRGTVGEVRRIVDGLRPAAVDELGLAGALQALATEDTAVRVTVRADLPVDLPAAVEVAAYRIAAEAVTNALRHAGGSSVELTARLEEGVLRVDVRDDGQGFGAGATAGVGLQSLHERAAEVGGELVVTSAPGAGTLVRAVLPVAVLAPRRDA